MPRPGAYEAVVYHGAEPVPRRRVSLRTASAVLAEIPKLLAEHPDCERIEVYHMTTFLFAVDCAGRRLPHPR